MTVVLDSSGWIELLSGSSRAKIYQPALRAGRLLVPAIVRYEVGRYTLSQGGPPAMELALRALARFAFIPMDEALADSAACLAHRHKFSLADARHLAVATCHRCDFLLTRNCRHLANGNKLRHLRKINEGLGLPSPDLVTPLELIEDSS